MPFMGKYHDNRPGFYHGDEIRGFVEPSGKRRKPWRGGIERRHATWQEISSWRFKTEEEARVWVDCEMFRLDRADEDRKLIYGEGSR